MRLKYLPLAVLVPLSTLALSQIAPPPGGGGGGGGGAGSAKDTNPANPANWEITRGWFGTVFTRSFSQSSSVPYDTTIQLLTNPLTSNISVTSFGASQIAKCDVDAKRLITFKWVGIGSAPLQV